MNVTVALSDHFGHCLLGSNRPKDFIKHNTIYEVINDNRTEAFNVIEEKTDTKFSFELNEKNITMSDEDGRILLQFENKNLEKAVVSAIKKALNKTYIKLKLNYHIYNEDKISPMIKTFPKL